MKVFLLLFVAFLALGSFLPTQALVHHYKFVVREALYTRLCSSKNILTINGQFPGPTLHLRQGDTILVDVYNRGTENITIHWHGSKQVRHPWSDGPEYITQCPIQPGAKFTQEIVLTDEIGTLWWHAHSDWNRATVHGALVVYPLRNDTYPFPAFDAEMPLILGEWWRSDVGEVITESLRTGGDPNISDAFTINGQPGDLYPCSRNDTFNLMVEYGKRYLIRMVNAAMNDILFFAIANHTITIVGSDGAYTKPLKSDYITISPGQTFDFLLEANQPPNRYYMAARAYNSAAGIVDFDNTTTTAIVNYAGNYSVSSPPVLPDLPGFADLNASVSFTSRLRSLATDRHPINVPQTANDKLLFTLSVNTIECRNTTCEGPLGRRLAASINNISFVQPDISILEAYYNNIEGVYSNQFPRFPPLAFNYTANNLSMELLTPQNGTKVRVVEYNSSVELVFQGTNVVAGIDHPMHLHGHSFFVVGWGIGNFDKERDPLNYNLVDPPLVNTIAVPRNGWAAIRFRANNPGVWLLHCHLERHISWGMEMAFIVKNGKLPEERLLPPPPDMPPC